MPFCRKRLYFTLYLYTMYDGNPVIREGWKLKRGGEGWKQLTRHSVDSCYWIADLIAYFLMDCLAWISCLMFLMYCTFQGLKRHLSDWFLEELKVSIVWRSWVIVSRYKIVIRVLCNWYSIDELITKRPVCMNSKICMDQSLCRRSWLEGQSIYDRHHESRDLHESPRCMNQRL